MVKNIKERKFSCDAEVKRSVNIYQLLCLGYFDGDSNMKVIHVWGRRTGALVKWK